jgi:hypothetical protein
MMTPNRIPPRDMIEQCIIRLKTLRPHQAVLSVAFAPDARMLAAATLETDVKLWQVSSRVER